MSDDYEPTGIDLVLESVQKIVTAHNRELAGDQYFSPTEWTAMHHDLWASYAAYLYEQQEASEHG